MWDAFATGLKPGSSVAAGQHIAYVGSNGQSSGPHLHFEVHPTVWRAGSQIDPMPWLAGALDPETLLTVAAVPVTDTLYADVSEWQRPVDDSYPYRVIAIRSNDGTYRDKNWASNYAWCKRRCDENALVFFIVYFVWRQNWQQTVDTLKNLVGQPHPRMAVMIDVESWQGQIIGNQSDGLNNAYRAVADWLGDRRRVIAYGNRGDLNSLWPYKPVGLRIVLASYGSNPGYPGKIAHQYTNGEGYGGGLPEGCPPFGKCCMDSADGLTPEQYASCLRYRRRGRGRAWRQRRVHQRRSRHACRRVQASAEYRSQPGSRRGSEAYKNSPVPSQASEEDRLTACGQGRLLKGAARGRRRRPT